MAMMLSVDIGTTKITANAVDLDSGRVVAQHAAANTAERTAVADRARGRSEWDIQAMADIACTCLHHVVVDIGARQADVLGIGITGQQHGVVIVDHKLAPLTPFINWQDRRGEDMYPGLHGMTFVQHMQQKAGSAAPERTGCRLATGYLGVSLHWLQEHCLLPPQSRACFATDYLAALLTGAEPVTDPTCAASSGLFNVVTNQWDQELIDVLRLPMDLFVPVKTSGDELGLVTQGIATRIALAHRVPVFVGIGDNQASFIGSVGDRHHAMLVNVGTGGQVAAFTDRFIYDPLMETRPFPRGGYLLVSAGLSGGAAYALLERFFRTVAKQLLDMPSAPSLFATMNRIAASVPPGAEGLRCEPFFFGTRAHPDLRGSWSGMSAVNFTPGHMARALLEGMAHTFHDGYGLIQKKLEKTRSQLVGAGNGIRENGLFAGLIAEQLGRPLHVPLHHEEAAYGAALVAAVGAGLVPSMDAAGRLIRYGEPVSVNSGS